MNSRGKLTEAVRELQIENGVFCRERPSVAFPAEGNALSAAMGE